MPDTEKLLSETDVSHAELFASATSDEITPDPTPEPQPEPQPEPAPQEAASEPKVDATGRVHGADGKFVPKQAPTDAAPIQQPPVPQETQEGHVPSWRVREETERRRAAEQRALEVERQLRELQYQRQQQQPSQPQVEVDPLTDPQGYARAITEQFEQRLARMQLDQNLQLSRVRHGEKFDEAFQAFMQEAERNPHFGQAVVRSSDPGGTLWQWYQGQTILREVGNDPTAYRQKLRDELMKDPAFQAEVIKLVQGANGSQQPGSRPQNITQLPPSLSRATGSAANTAETSPTGAEIFQHALHG